MSDWLNDLKALIHRGEPGVLVTVAETRGSAPRGAGTRMLVARDACFGTIGGGNLEFKAIEIARAGLADTRVPGIRLRRFPLGPSLGQCCGGVAVLLFEPVDQISTTSWLEPLLQLRRTRRNALMISLTNGPINTGKLIVTTDDHFGYFGYSNGADTDVFRQQAVTIARQMLANDDDAQLRALALDSGQTPPVTLLFEPLKMGDFHIVLFGAGHVGKALVQVLSGLPCTIIWIDSRTHEFPQNLPANVTPELSAEPEYEVAEAPPGSYFLILTHSHALDQLICEQVLQRADFAYCGLIGSATKLRKFKKRMRVHGLSEQTLSGLTCPIGVAGISGKQPTEIAIAVAAQLLQVREQAAQSVKMAACSM